MLSGAREDGEEYRRPGSHLSKVLTHPRPGVGSDRRRSRGVSNPVKKVLTKSLPLPPSACPWTSLESPETKRERGRGSVSTPDRIGTRGAPPRASTRRSPGRTGPRREWTRWNLLRGIPSGGRWRRGFPGREAVPGDLHPWRHDCPAKDAKGHKVRDVETFRDHP